MSREEARAVLFTAALIVVVYGALWLFSHYKIN